MASEAKHSIFLTPLPSTFLRHSIAIMLTKSPRLIASSSEGDCNMEPTEYTTKLDELDHLLNDPDVKLEPDRVWMLLAELSRHDLQSGAAQHPA